MIGQTLGHYRVVERLGEGGMGEVFRAVDELVDRDVALKMLRPELAHRGDVAERFRAEAITLAKLDHPNIARLHGMGKTDPQLFMVIEFVPGDTLAARIDRHGRLPWRDAVDAVAQVLDGLAYAHDLGVIHRDIKPANVIVRPDGRVKITDFGIARVLGTSRATRTGFIVGTLEYMAPEQIRGEDVDARADLYAAGIVFYQLLTGRVPFSATTEFELMRLQLEGAVPPVHPVTDDVPSWCDDVIAKALTKLPANRFSTAAAFRAELLRLAGTEPGESGVKATRLSPAPMAATRLAIQPKPRFSWTRARVGTAAAMATLLVASPFAWRAMHPQSAPRLAPASPAMVTGSPVAAGGDGPTAPPLLLSPGRTTRPSPSAPPSPPASAPSTPPSSLPVVPPAAVPAVPPAVPAREALPEVAPKPSTRTVVGADAYFDEESLMVIAGAKSRQRDIILRFVGGRVDLLDRKTRVEIKTLALSRVESAIYSRSKQPRWRAASAGVVLGGVFAAPLFFMKGTQHWLTLEGAGDPIVIRLDKDSWQQVVVEIEQRSSIKVVMTGERE